MGRSPCCDENGLKKGPWTPEEDQKLVQHIEKHGYGSWRALPKQAGLNRCGKSCRLRWTNYLRPDIKRGRFSPEEEQTILNLHSILGNKWSAIATHLPGRTDNEIKNFWNTHLKKKLIQMGFDPMTHRPRTDIFASLPHLIALANLKQLVDRQPWDDHAVRLQAEAIKMANLQYQLQYLLQQPFASAMAAGTSNINSSLSSSITSEGMENTTSMLSTSHELPSVPSMDNIQVTQFSNFSELQVPCTFQQQIMSNDTNLQNSCLTVFSAQGEEDMSLPSYLPPLTDVSLGNQGDACSTPSCGAGDNGTPSWHELLLDDSFITEFA